MPNRPAGGKEFARRKDAVAEACFGHRAEAGNRAASGERSDFPFRHVGRVNQAPASIDGRVFQQPFHRPLPRPGHAILHLTHLFGGVDVDRVGAGKRNDRRKLVGRHCAKAVRGDADVGAGQFSDRLARGSHQRGEPIDRADEATLPGVRRCAAESAVGIETRQQRKPDAGGLSCLRNTHGHLSRIGVRRAVAIMMEIVKLTDARKAALEHLDIEQGRNGCDVVGCHRQRKAVHRLAPGPERIGAVAAQFGKAGHAALKRVAVQARQSRNCQLVTLISGGGGHACRHRDDRAVGDHDLHVIGPARRQQRECEMQSCHFSMPAGQNRHTIICLDI
ncbi:hypothetical protein ACVIGA_007446 [Bradyrhizobium sp. USDA 3240]